MTDYRTLVIDMKFHTGKFEEWSSTLIHTYDPDSILSLLRDLITHNAKSRDPQPTMISRYITDTPMRCTNCNRWEEQQEYTLDKNEKQAKCPHCDTWVFIEDCEVEEL